MEGGRVLQRANVPAALVEVVANVVNVDGIARAERDDGRKRLAIDVKPGDGFDAAGGGINYKLQRDLSKPMREQPFARRLPHTIDSTHPA